MSVHQLLLCDRMHTLGHPGMQAGITSSPLVCLTDRTSGCFETAGSDFGSTTGSAVSAESSADRYSDDGWNVLSPSITPPATPSAGGFTASSLSGGQSSPVSSVPYMASASPVRETYHRSHMHSPALEAPGPMQAHQQLKWRSYPPPLLTEALGIDFLKACTEHLPLDAGHWTLLKQLAASGQLKILTYILKNCLRHENPCELQSRPQNAVRNVGGYLTKVIRQKTQLFQRRPDIVAMMDDLCVSSPAMAAQMDGRILQLLSESVQNPEGIAACQSIMSLPPAAGRPPHQHQFASQQQLQQYPQQYHSPAALQRDLKCYVDHASWVENLLGTNGAW